MSLSLDGVVDTMTRGRDLAAHSFTGAVVHTMGCPEDGLAVRGGWNILIANAEVSESYGRSTYTLALTASQDQQARHSAGGMFVTCIVAGRPISVTG